MVAGVEYISSRAGTEATVAAGASQKYDVERQGEVVRANASVDVKLATIATAQEQRGRQGNATQKANDPLAPKSADQLRTLEQERSRWQSLAALTDQLAGVGPNDAASPEQDQQFPNRLVAESQRAVYRNFALKDAADEVAAGWGNRVNTYRTILTIFAVAIYLLGLSLALGRDIRRFIAGVGVALLLTGGLWVTITQLGAIPTPPDAAADDYAAGEVALLAAASDTGTDGYKTAYQHFSDAIGKRPTFAQAYVDRSVARPSMDPASPGSGVGKVASLEARQAVRADLQKAYQLGLRTKRLLGDLAYSDYLVGLEQNNPQLLRDSLDTVNAALKLDDADPALLFNRGAALLALDRVDEARASYRSAIDHSRYTDSARKSLRSGARAEELVAGALTDLDLLPQFHASRADDARGMKEMVVLGTFSPDQEGHGTTVKPSTDLRANVSPAGLSWTGTIPGLAPATDAVSTQWYFRDQRSPAWSVVPTASSGNSSPAPSQAGAGQVALATDYLHSTSRCLAPGSYRVEVYVDGRAAGTATIDTGPGFGSPGSIVAQDLGIEACLPVSWVPASDRSVPLSGFSTGYQSADKTEGFYMYRYQQPVAATSSPESIASAFRDATARGLPVGPRGASGVGPGIATPAPADNDFLKNRQGIGASRYAYGGGYALLISGLFEGGVLVFAVYGPDPVRADSPGHQFLSSVEATS